MTDGAFVVDVNVAIAANGKSPQADTQCELSCVQWLEAVRNALICLDDDDLIMGEYRNHLSMRGQPGVGDEFMYWIYQNQYTTRVCERVRITEHARGFEEFPDDPALAGFDPSDRKYVAVARTSRRRPTILNAVDSDWRDFAKQLQGHGVSVSELCPQCLREASKD